MKAKKPLLFPKAQKVLIQLGENIKLVRLRRKLSAEQVAERADITRVTWQASKGKPRCSNGAFCIELRKRFIKSSF